MPPCLIIAFREIKLAPLAGVIEDGTKQQWASPPTELCSSMLLRLRAARGGKLRGAYWKNIEH